MKTQRSIEAYDMTAGEKVTYGYFTVLDLVFSRYVNELESLFFDLFKLPFDFEFQIRSDMKFKRYLDTFSHPSPIFVFGTSPHMGDSFLKMDNASANLFLARKQQKSEISQSVNHDFLVNSQNYKTLQSAIEPSLNRYYGCWDQFFQMNGSLKKLVSHKIKAKIMDPNDACVIVELHFGRSALEFKWEFCFSAYQLDQIIKKYGAKVLLAGSGDKTGGKQTQARFEDFLSTKAEYTARGVLGQLEVSQKEILAHYHNQSVIPIKNDIQDNVVVFINNSPVLSAVAGTTHESISLKIKGKYDEAKTRYKTHQKPFVELAFPKK